MIHEHDEQRAAGSPLSQVGACARGATSVGGIAEGGVEVTSLSIDMIRCDGGTQMRVGLNQEAVESYAEYMEDGAEFPPVVVFHDGNAYWLADGFHRVAARQRVAAKHVGTDAHRTWSVIAVDVRAGTREDAIRFAIGANKTNGLRRTNADKQVAVRAALAHPAMQGMSDRAIANEAGVSDWLVRSMRQLRESRTSTQPPESTHKAVNTASDKNYRTGIDGKKYPVRQRAAPKTSAPKKSAAKKQMDSPKHASGDAGAAADSRASAIAKHKRICPMCNGEGYVDE